MIVLQSMLLIMAVIGLIGIITEKHKQDKMSLAVLCGINTVAFGLSLLWF